MENQELYNLIQKASSGDELAFEQLYSYKAKSILYRTVQITGNLQDGEDIAQEVVLKMYHNIGKLKNPKLFGSWLHSIIVNECNKMFRSRNAKKQPITVAEEYSAYMVEDRAEFLPAEYVENEEKQNELMEIIHSLPEKQQNVLLLYYYEGLSCAEIASVNKTSVGTVTSYLTKAKRAILKRIGDGGSVKTLSMMQGLSMLYHENADRLISNATVSHFVENVSHNLGGIAATTVAASAVTLSLAAKTVIGISAGVILAAGSVATGARLTNPGNISSPSGKASSVPQIEAALPQDENIEILGFHLTSVPINGRVHRKGNDGEVLEGQDPSLQNLEILLINQDGEEVARAQTDENGAYDFGALALGSNTHYSLQLSLPGGTEYKVITGTQYFTPDEAFNTDLFIAVTSTPQGEVTAVSNDCLCGHINPVRIAYENPINPIDSYHWQILSGNKILYNGESEAIENELIALRQQGKDGDYTAVFDVVDIHGNAARVRYEFAIKSGTIVKNQYP